MIFAKFQPKTPSISGEKVDFNDFVVIFSTGGHLGILDQIESSHSEAL